MPLAQYARNCCRSKKFASGPGRVLCGVDTDDDDHTVDCSVHCRTRNKQATNAEEGEILKSCSCAYFKVHFRVSSSLFHDSLVAPLWLLESWCSLVPLTSFNCLGTHTMVCVTSSSGLHFIHSGCGPSYFVISVVFCALVRFILLTKESICVSTQSLPTWAARDKRLDGPLPTTYLDSTYLSAPPCSDHRLRQRASLLAVARLYSSSVRKFPSVPNPTELRSSSSRPVSALTAPDCRLSRSNGPTSSSAAAAAAAPATGRYVPAQR